MGKRISLAKKTKSAKKRVKKLSSKISKVQAKGKTKRAARLKKRAFKIEKTGKRGTGRTIDKAKKTAKRIQGSKAGKIVSAAVKVYQSARKGKVKGTVDAGKQLVSAVKAKRSYPKKVRKTKRA